MHSADTGLVVNGDDITAVGLVVEHCQKIRRPGAASGANAGHADNVVGRPRAGAPADRAR